MNIQGYETRKVHISTIKHGDTILHVDGKISTVGRNNIRRGFCGITIFGDSYNLGTKPVILMLTNPNGTLRIKK